jgi:hypothetical protein
MKTYKNNNNPNIKYYDKGYSKEKWVEKLKEIDSHHYDKQKMLLDAEKYNL